MELHEAYVFDGKDTEAGWGLDVVVGEGDVDASDDDDESVDVLAGEVDGDVVGDAVEVEGALDCGAEGVLADGQRVDGDSSVRTKVAKG